METVLTTQKELKDIPKGKTKPAKKFGKTKLVSGTDYPQNR